MFTRATLRELTRLALPMVVSQGAFAVMVFTDRVFMSSLDSAHIAAALGGGVASFFCMSLFIGLISYGNALVAQYYGAGKFARCSKVTTQGLYLALASTPVLILAGYYGKYAFEHLGHEAVQVPLEQAYFEILMYGAVFALIKAALASYFSGIGRTRVVMVADVIGTGVNIPLSWVLIFGKFGFPAMGIQGAALGTVLATLITIAVFFTFYMRAEHRQQFSVDAAWQFERSIMRRYLRLGMPSGLETFMNVATFNLFLLLFQSYGVIEGAAMAIVFNWDMLSFIPMVGLNIAVMSLIGRFVGAGDMARANEVIAAGFMLAFAYAGTLSVIFLIFRIELVAFFDTGGADFPAILAIGSQMMVGLVTYMLADATILISGAVLRGAGDTRWIMLTSMSLHWVMLVIQYLTIVVYRLDALISWWVFVATLLILAIIYLWRLLGNTWRRPERLAKVLAES
ncbi:MAG: MATE family efflux transporter [Halioglobus sp.]